VDGFIVVDLPPEEAVKFRDLTAEFGYSLSHPSKCLLG
jgi:tryptophan synthase alpha subunit